MEMVAIWQGYSYCPNVYPHPLFIIIFTLLVGQVCVFLTDLKNRISVIHCIMQRGIVCPCNPILKVSSEAA